MVNSITISYSFFRKIDFFLNNKKLVINDYFKVFHRKYLLIKNVFLKFELSFSNKHQKTV